MSVFKTQEHSNQKIQYQEHRKWEQRDSIHASTVMPTATAIHTVFETNGALAWLVDVSKKRNAVRIWMMSLLSK